MFRSKYDPIEAERLKVIGNELYQKEQYQEALFIYSEALQRAPMNPIIFANRAAAFLATKE